MADQRFGYQGEQPAERYPGAERVGQETNGRDEIDVEDLADRVYRLMLDDARLERSRRGRT